MRPSFPSSVCPGYQRVHVRTRQRTEAFRHDPDDVGAKISALVLQTKRDGVVARCPVTAAVTMGTTRRLKPRESLPDDAPRVRHLLPHRFPAGDGALVGLAAASTRTKPAQIAFLPGVTAHRAAARNPAVAILPTSP